MHGLRRVIGRYKIDGDVKNSIGNGEAKELICMTHGHELREGLLEGGDCWREGEYRAEEGKGGKIGTSVIV